MKFYEFISWERAYRHRSCPPAYVLCGPQTTELQAHLESCRWCTEDIRYCKPDTFLPPKNQIPRQPEPREGQIWSLSPDLAGWGPKNRYYSPPLVFLVGHPDPHVFNVVQVYGDPTFMGPDDIPIGNGMVGFAESWNRYTVVAKDLHRFFSRVDIHVLDMVQQWRPVQKVEQGSLLWFFRNMEVETGFFFGSRAVENIIYEEENK